MPDGWDRFGAVFWARYRNADFLRQPRTFTPAERLHSERLSGNDYPSVRNSRKTGQPDDGEAFLIERLCEKEHCHCENGSIALSALKHTGNILVFVLAVTFLLNLSFLFLGEDTLNSLVKAKPLPGILISALIGLIPNCGASVLLTQMYLHGILPASHLIAGLLDGAGVGLLILFRVNPEHRQNLFITGLLYLLSVLFGLLLYFLNAAF